MIESRRHALQHMAMGGTLALSATWSRDLFAQETPSDALPATGATEPRLKPLDEMMTSFVKQHQVPGAALAVMRGSELVYARGFGFADVEGNRPVEPESLFRIASISKPLTATAILKLTLQGKFQLDDRVFDVLSADQWLPAKYDERLRTITIRQLLQHTGGWDRDKSFDPIGNAAKAAEVLGKPLPANAVDITRYTLTLPLDFDPGARYAYANVDYLLLGRIIEHITGESYETHVSKAVLAPAGITRMQLGRAHETTLAKDEVRYYDRKKRMVKAINGARIGEQVPLVYGGENLEAYEAHGGWIASAVDVAKFGAALTSGMPDALLPPNLLAELASRPSGNAGWESDGKPRAFYYGLGFSVRPVGDQGRYNLWHTGLIAGTSTLLVCRHDGFRWAVLFNTDRSPDNKVLAALMDPLIHQAVDALKW
jgi:CubicO group peptidase (beta-lactamase class C family)